VARQIGADMTCHLDGDLHRIASVLMGEPKHRRCRPPLLGWQTVYDSANNPVMSTDKLKSLGTRTLSLWRIVKLFREVGAKGVPVITAEVKQKTAQILDTLDPVTRMVSQINEPGYAHKVLTDTTDAAATAAVSAIEKTSLVLGHSILDEVISECCDISSELMPEKWLGLVLERKLTLNEALGTPVADISQQMLTKYLFQLKRESLRTRIDRLNERYQPAPAFDYDGSSYKFDADRLGVIDLHRQRIIHQVELARSEHDNELDDLHYLEATCFYFINIVAHKHGLTFDPTREVVDLLRLRDSSPVQLVYEGLLLATSLPSAEEHVWSSGGQIFASDNRRSRQLPLLMPAATPDLSVDHERLVFVKYRKRAGNMSRDGFVDGRNAYIGDIWMSAIDGSGAEIVLEGGPRPGLAPPVSGFPEELEGITSPKFDPEGQRVYFIADAWATSGAIYVLDLGTREVKFLTDGNGFAVLHGEPHRGSLLVSKHRYYDAPQHGSYDHFWLVSATAKVGEDYGPDFNGALTRLYGSGGRKLALPNLI